MFDRLKFWQRDQPDPFGAPVEDPMRGSSDPLAQPSDPLAQASRDPLQSSELFGQPVAQDPMPAPQGQYPQAGVMSSLRLGQQLAHQVPQEYEEVHPQVRDRDTELILAKLDAIKSEIDSLHQRVRKIEQHAEQKRYW